MNKIVSKSSPRRRARHTALERARNALRRAMRSLRERDEFLAAIAHELRAPMTVVHSVVKLAATGEFGPLDPKSERLAQIALRNSERIVRTLENLLDLARLDSGLAHPRLVRVEAAVVLEEAVADVRLLLPGAAGSLEVAVEDAPPPAMADREMLLQLLQNLLANALRFARSRVLARVLPRGGRVVFEVQDDGPGLPEELKPHLFQPYEQGERRGAGYKGTGLGLAICRRIAHLHRTRLEFENAPEGGAVFRFSLPGAPRENAS